MQIAEQASAIPRVTVTYAGTPLSYVLADFERAGRRSIARSIAVDTMSIGVRFVSQPWDSAFASVIQALGLVSFELPTGAIVVRTGAEDELLVKTEPTITAFVQLRTSRVTAVIDKLKGGAFTLRSGYSIDTVGNNMTITEVVSRMPRLRALIHALDQPQP